MYDYLTAESGFKPCPICGSYKRLVITNEQSFYETKGREGYILIHLGCNNCNLELWSHRCKEPSYSKHREWVKRRWNMLGGERREDE